MKKNWIVILFAVIIVGIAITYFWQRNEELKVQMYLKCKEESKGAYVPLSSPCSKYLK